ncbi:MAG: WYL domain-containing protein [Rhodoferax sp.]|nr:WYL domain-containing protein [Rhodoferax sp.]
MRRRPDTLETLSIALELLRRIPRGRKISAAELHTQLSDAGLARDIRTIQRQLEMLTRKFDIERDERTSPYGYRWKELAKGMTLPSLTEQESLLLTLAEQHLNNLLPANLMKSMSSFFAQARSNIGPHTNAKREREWLAKVRVVSETQPLLPPKIRPGVFDEVSNALYANRWLALDYRNASGKDTQTEVMPLGLAQQGPRLYLVCRFPGYDNERSLALHRITSARGTSRSFDRPKEFDLRKYDDDGRFGFGEGERIRLTFRITKAAGRHLLESPLSTDQQVVELEDQFEISATVVDTERLQWWLRGFGEHVTQVSAVRKVLCGKS